MTVESRKAGKIGVVEMRQGGAMYSGQKMNRKKQESSRAEQREAISALEIYNRVAKILGNKLQRRISNWVKNYTLEFNGK